MCIFCSFLQETFATNYQADSVFQDSTIFLNQEIIITAQRQKSATFSVPEAVSVLNKEKLSYLSPMSMPDALASMPGVWMQKTNHGGGSPFLRGLTGYQTLLLIDGVRFNNTTFRSGPNQYLNTIDPLITDRIEVIRGQGSVQYGSDAIGGVVQMMTHSPEFSSQGVVWGGYLYSKYLSSDMEKTGRVSLSMKSEKTAVSGGFTSKNLGDIKAGGDIGKLNSTGYKEYSMDFKLLQKVGKNHLFSAAYQRHLQKDVPLYHKLASGEYSRYSFDKQQRDLAYVKWEVNTSNKLFSQIRFTQSFQNSIEIRTKQKSNENTIKEEEDQVNTFGSVFEVISRPSDIWSVSSGVEYYHDNVNSTGVEYSQNSSERNGYRGLYPDNSSAGNFAVYSLHTIELPKVDFSLGGRYNAVWLTVPDELFDQTTISPSAFVGNAGVTYKMSAKYHLVGSVNSGFRAPNINDVSSFGIADFRYEVPNYDLNPEKSVNMEVGIKSKSDRLSYNLYFYRNSLKDLITNVRSTYNGQSTIDGVQVYKRVNVGSAVLKGVESDVEYLITPKLLAQANLTYTHGQNVSGDEPMRRIPPFFGSMGLFYHVSSRLKLNSVWAHAGKQDRLSNGDIDDDRIAEGGTPSWNTFEVSAHYIRSKMQLQAGIKNLFNEAYRTHGSGVDGIGRSVWVSLRLNL